MPHMSRVETRNFDVKIKNINLKNADRKADKLVERYQDSGLAGVGFFKAEAEAFKESAGMINNNSKLNDKQKMNALNQASEIFMNSLDALEVFDHALRLYENQQGPLDDSSQAALFDAILEDHKPTELKEKGRLDYTEILSPDQIKEDPDGHYDVSFYQRRGVDADSTAGRVEMKKGELIVENVQDLKPKEFIKKLKEAGIDADKKDIRRLKRALRAENYERFEKLLEKKEILKDDGVTKANVDIEQEQTGTETVQNGYQPVGDPIHEPMTMKQNSWTENPADQINVIKAVCDEKGLNYNPEDFAKAINGEISPAQLVAKLSAANPDIKTDELDQWVRFAAEERTRNIPGQMQKGSGESAAIMLDPYMVDSSDTNVAKLFKGHKRGSVDGHSAHFTGNMSLVETDGLKFYGHGKSTQGNKSFIDKGKIQLANGHTLEMKDNGNIVLDGKVLEEGQKINLGKDSDGENIILETLSGVDKHFGNKNGKFVGAKDIGTNFKLTAGEVEIQSRLDGYKGDKLWSFMTTKIKDNGVDDKGLLIDMLDGKKNTQKEINEMMKGNYINNLDGWFKNPFQAMSDTPITEYRLGHEFFQQRFEPSTSERPVYEDNVSVNLRTLTPELIRGIDWTVNIEDQLYVGSHDANNHG